MTTQLYIISTGLFIIQLAFYGQRLLSILIDYRYGTEFIGGGYNFSRNLLGHYAHNDFIEILATHGYSGVRLYLYSIIQLFKNYFENHPRKILVVSAVTIWLFNAMFNMFYYYICAALSFPFLLFTIDWYSNEKEII